ncbi:DNA sulfur modification protein DndB [Nocardiopsis sp. JB363]|uniref:DNA sulfur modification protein DndB n=1 Tax=Nocardiopsis sp. JB363 TaxID=1434837 RepID=UPI000B3572FB|nr:DNA sulfur modification protein DndB [Nocardiopsis sp. JB363]
MSMFMPTARAEGITLPVMPFRQTAVVGTIGLATLLQMAHSPKLGEDPRALKYQSGATRRHAEVRALVQRMIKSTNKGKNVPEYAEYIAAGIKGEYGNGWSTPPVTLWIPSDDEGDAVIPEGRELVEGTGIQNITIISGTPVIAIDGETQVTALHELYDDPEAYGLTYAKLRGFLVPFELYWGLSVEDARQIFYDRNVQGVPVAKNLAMSMDQRDFGTQLAHSVAKELIVEHQGELVEFSKLVQARKRQLGKNDPEVITLSGLRALVVTVLFGRGGIQLTSSSVDESDLPEGVKPDEARDTVVELVGSTINDLFPHFASRSAVSTPAVLAGLGIAGHQAMPWADGDKVTPETFRDLLVGIKWERRASYWGGISGRAVGVDDGISFAGGVKDSGGRVADAILYPHTIPGKKIRGQA